MAARFARCSLWLAPSCSSAVCRCYEQEPLLLMSGHVSDHSKKMPLELLQTIVNSKKANAGIFNKRQCSQCRRGEERASRLVAFVFPKALHSPALSCIFVCVVLGLFDQAIHTRPEADTAKVYEEICAAHWPIQPTANTNFSAGFGHLAGGYDAQYYGYMWSEVFSADMFESRFLKEGLLNAATGSSYRKEVISRGGSVDATVMLRNFLGREPNDKAFLRSKGLSV